MFCRRPKAHSGGYADRASPECMHRPTQRSAASAGVAQAALSASSQTRRALVQRRVAIIAEVPKADKAEPAERMAARARTLRRAGVQALCVRTDAYDTDTGLRDLFGVVRAVPDLPVLRRDWIIHPLQVRPMPGACGFALPHC